MAGDKLSPAQALFVKEYFKDLNATRAYRAAYPNSSPGAANTDGPRLTKLPKSAERREAGRPGRC